MMMFLHVLKQLQWRGATVATIGTKPLMNFPRRGQHGKRATRGQHHWFTSGHERAFWAGCDRAGMS